ncbi:hypothetical protein CRG98_036523 [Punica granatum]|uniref:Uncharacterized protein n=1 Tax=Punica granatum TaxID=22663 RepID=A0A2I0IGC7_PUNGR|nr:hypothetical protein CRG98_036523 [Punica granatum]
MALFHTYVILLYLSGYGMPVGNPAGHMFGTQALRGPFVVSFSHTMIGPLLPLTTLPRIGDDPCRAHGIWSLSSFFWHALPYWICFNRSCTVCGVAPTQLGPNGAFVGMIMALAAALMGLLLVLPGLQVCAWLEPFDLPNVTFFN